jgi:hypothetical protein
MSLLQIPVLVLVLLLVPRHHMRASIVMPSQPAKSWATSQKSSLVEREKEREREGIGRFAHRQAKTQPPRKKRRLLAWCERKRCCFLQLLNPVRRSAAVHPSRLLRAKVHHISHQITPKSIPCTPNRNKQSLIFPNHHIPKTKGQSSHHRHHCEMG